MILKSGRRPVNEAVDETVLRGSADIWQHDWQAINITAEDLETGVTGGKNR